MSGEAVVIGAGIVGASCAWRLAREGFRVRVIDPRGIGFGASAAGMGHIVVIDEPAPELALTKRSRDLWDEVLPRLPAEAGWRRCGTLWIATDAEQLEAARAKTMRLLAAGVEAKLISGDEVAAREPKLRPGLAGGLLVPGDSIVLPPIAARWLLRDAGIEGERSISGRTALSIEPGGVVLDDGSRLRADVIVNAAGMWARELTRGLPLRPRKGHLWMTEARPGFCSHQIVELGYIQKAHASDAVSVSFNVQPRASGHLVIGSSRQFDIETESIDEPVYRAMCELASTFMPDLQAIGTERAWTGVRAATPDGLPIIGRHPAMQGVYIAGGHEGLGLTMAMGTAELVADAAMGRQSAIDPAPFVPARYAGMLV